MESNLKSVRERLEIERQSVLEYKTKLSASNNETIKEQKLNQTAMQEINTLTVRKKIESVDLSVLITTYTNTSCNYRLSTFYQFISLLLSCRELYLSNKPKQCIQKSETMKCSILCHYTRL